MESRVEEKEHGWSLLTFVKAKIGSISVSQAKKTIEDKKCRINGRTEFFSSRKLVTGDKVSIDLYIQEKNQVGSWPILFQDEHFAIINKPPGFVCLDAVFHKRLGPIAQDWKLIHRLDKDTSGLILLAKTSEAEALGKELFQKREIQKWYLAVVQGKVLAKEGAINNFLGKKGSYQGQTLYGSVQESEGKRAITHWKRLRATAKASILLCELKTGRTHQIRVHLQEMGHPILGDSQYSIGSCDIRPRRQLLHAWRVIFIHPFTGKKMDIKAPIPLDLQETLGKLGLDFELDV